MIPITPFIFSTAWTMVFTETCVSERLFCVRSANFLTSSATTAKPRPCSPARAASMAALVLIGLFDLRYQR